MPSWRALAAINLLPLFLINCAGTVTRQLDDRDPVAYESAINDMKSTESEVLMRDGAVYSGNITRVRRDTVDLKTLRAHSKIPADRISNITITDHGLGAMRGMQFGALWVGGIAALIGAGSGNFIPGLFFGALYGGAIGLITGGIGGAHVVYQFPNGGSQTIHTEAPELKKIEADGKPQDKDSTVHTAETLSIPKINSPAPDEFVALENLGTVRILLKDGTEKKSCAIREIRGSGIVYEKSGVLHDLAIANILRIEMSKDGGTRIVVIDKDRKLKLIPKEH